MSKESWNSRVPRSRVFGSTTEVSDPLHRGTSRLVTSGLGKAAFAAEIGHGVRILRSLRFARRKDASEDESRENAQEQPCRDPDGNPQFHPASLVSPGADITGLQPAARGRFLRRRGLLTRGELARLEKQIRIYLGL